MNKNSRLVYSTEKGRIHEEIRPDCDSQKDRLIFLKLGFFLEKIGELVMLIH